MAGQFHGARDQQASAFSGDAGRAVDVAGQARPQTGQGAGLRLELGFEARLGTVDVAVEGAQEEAVLVAEGGVEAAAG